MASGQESPAPTLCPDALPKSPACCQVTVQHWGQQPVTGAGGCGCEVPCSPTQAARCCHPLHAALTRCTLHSGCTLLSPAACCCHLLCAAAMPGAPSRAVPALGCGSSSVPSRGCAAAQKGRLRDRLCTSTCTVATINSMKDCAGKSSPDAGVAKL